MPTTLYKDTLKGMAQVAWIKEAESSAEACRRWQSICCPKPQPVRPCDIAPAACEFTRDVTWVKQEAEAPPSPASSASSFNHDSFATEVTFEPEEDLEQEHDDGQDMGRDLARTVLRQQNVFAHRLKTARRAIRKTSQAPRARRQLLEDHVKVSMVLLSEMDRMVESLLWELEAARAEVDEKATSEERYGTEVAMLRARLEQVVRDKAQLEAQIAIAKTAGRPTMPIPLAAMGIEEDDAPCGTAAPEVEPSSS